jgi:DNA-binding response OmpR family regulator
MLRNQPSTVVVADPDPDSQRQVIALLEPSFHCIAAGSLREASEVILRERPILITLELEQPDGDGMGFIRYLQTEPALQHILIACVTHRSSIADKVRAFRAGADDYIVKPPHYATFRGQMLLLQRTGHMARNFMKR